MAATVSGSLLINGPASGAFRLSARPTPQITRGVTIRLAVVRTYGVASGTRIMKCYCRFRFPAESSTGQPGCNSPPAQAGSSQVAILRPPLTDSGPRLPTASFSRSLAPRKCWHLSSRLAPGHMDCRLRPKPGLRFVQEGSVCFCQGYVCRFDVSRGLKRSAGSDPVVASDRAGRPRFHRCSTIPSPRADHNPR